jgi:hypothetical protein
MTLEEQPSSKQLNAVWHAHRANGTAHRADRSNC